jgi:NitT/TauT family transport system substrate-binding protein
MSPWDFQILSCAKRNKPLTKKETDMPGKTLKSFRHAIFGVVTSFVLFAGTCAHAQNVVVSHYAELMPGAPWAVALNQGYFKKYGAPITGISSSEGGGTTLRNMLAGQLPYTETALPAALAAIHAGIKLKIVDDAVNNAADLVWVTMPNSPLKSIHDLIGHKMAYTQPGSTTQLFEVLALQASGIDLKQVQRVSLGSIGGGLTALEHGAVDAAPELEPTYSRNIAKYRLLFSAASVLPPITQHVGVASPEFLKNHLDQVKAIIAARRAGILFMQAHPDQAAVITANAYDMPVQTISIVLKTLLKANYWNEGKLDFKAMDRAVAGLYAMGIYPTQKVDWSSIVDESALPEDLKSTP